MIKETPRLEVKFVATPENYHHVLSWLRVHPAGFLSPYPDRQVNNIYFDTHDCSAFAENLSGASSRTKVRYRWYGNSMVPDAGTLEVKQKRNCHGRKLRFKIDKPPYEPGANWLTIRHMLLEQLPVDGKGWLNSNPVPVIINRYCRKYLISADGKVRITIDTQLSIWEQRLKPYPNFIHRANTADIIVIEVKLDRIDHEIASGIIQGLPFRQSRHSKYITGVKAVSRI